MPSSKTDQAEAASETAPGNADAVSEYTQEVLMEMRKRGLPKPVAVSESAWISAQPPVDIPRRAAIYQTLINSPMSQSNKAAFVQAAPLAFEAVLDVLQNPNESGRNVLSAASIILEQAVGKPGQTVEVSGSIYLDIRREIAEAEARGYKPAMLIDAKATPASSLDSSMAAVDAFIEAHDIDSFSVGKRSPSDKESK